MKEVNFDGLAGPTHHFAGLSFGNLAAMKHAKQISSPKKAALQGLKKMKKIMDLGIPQAVLPPQERPSLFHLRQIGFRGSDTEILNQVGKASPQLLHAVSSSSAMWRANSATITPSCDSWDGRVHMTIANLQSTFHRSLEAKETERLFKLLFSDPEIFALHPPLPFSDEGSANHLRFCTEYGKKGVHLFVYGKSLFSSGPPTRFPARQSLQASEAIARLHGGQAFFARQNPTLIDKGVFHNDIISLGNRDLFLYHEEAFENTQELLNQIERVFPLKKIKISLSIEEAIETYLFNSQLLTLPNGQHLLLASEECQKLDLSWLPFALDYVDLSESLHNGGGPACLRLAIPLSEEEIQNVHPFIFLTDTLYEKLVRWVGRYYRDRLHLEDLKDPLLLRESYEALDSLTQILNLNSFYTYQN